MAIHDTTKSLKQINNGKVLLFISSTGVFCIAILGTPNINITINKLKYSGNTRVGPFLSESLSGRITEGDSAKLEISC